MRCKTVRSIILFVLTTSALSQGQVSIVASSEFKPAIEEIRKAFQDQTGIPTRAAYGSSGAMAQRAMAAGTDIFLSSDKFWADSLASTSRADDKPLVLATEPVCVWVRGSVLDPSSELEHLGERSPGEIVIADTLLSPDGAAVVKALHNLPNWNALRQRLVMLPDPGAVVDSLTQQHTASASAPIDTSVHTKDSVKTADSSKPVVDSIKNKNRPAAKKTRSLANGFLPQPLLWNNAVAGTGRWTPIDPTLVPVLQPTVLRLKSLNAPRTDAAIKFLAFLQSPRARSIFRSNGFLPAP